MCNLSMFNSFIKANDKHTLIWAICERPSSVRRSCSEGSRGYGGYPAWIRTKNNASKGRCVTVTPRGIPKGDFRLAILDQTAISKMPTEVAFESRITPKAFGAVTVAPPGMGICDFRLAIFDSSATSKIQVCLRFRKATYGEN